MRDEGVFFYLKLCNWLYKKTCKPTNPDPESKLSGASVCKKKEKKNLRHHKKIQFSPLKASWVVEQNAAAPALEIVFLSISRSSLFDNFLSFGAFRPLFSQTKKLALGSWYVSSLHSHSCTPVQRKTSDTSWGAADTRQPRPCTVWFLE